MLNLSLAFPSGDTSETSGMDYLKLSSLLFCFASLKKKKKKKCCSWSCEGFFCVSLIKLLLSSVNTFKVTLAFSCAGSSGMVRVSLLLLIKRSNFFMLYRLLCWHYFPMAIGHRHCIHPDVAPWNITAMDRNKIEQHLSQKSTEDF